MSTGKDIAKAVKDGLVTVWDPEDGSDPHPEWHPTLHVDDDFRPTVSNVALLVADDGGPTLLRGPWMNFHGIGARRPLLRLTAFAKGREEARTVVQTAVDWVRSNHTSAGIARIEDVPDPDITRDRATGAYLASIIMPTVVRPVIE